MGGEGRGQKGKGREEREREGKRGEELKETVSPTSISF